MIKKNIIHIVGARPQFIKLGILLKVLEKVSNVKNLIIHTGQHYDYEMSKTFFKELSISHLYVDFNLEKLLTQN